MPIALTIFILYLICILMLLLVLTIHELGHFVFAKIYKINVKEFAIGFGPKLWYKTTKSGMRLSLRLIPLAAYVVLDSKVLRSYYVGNKKNKNYAWMMSPKPKQLFYLEQTNLWRYTQIMFGGVLFNFVAFFLIYIPIICINPSFAVVPWISIGDTFVGVGKNMAFMGQGDIFGQIPSLPDQLSSAADWGGAFLGTFLLINLLSFVFNLFPIPPLDGWKIFKQSFEKITNKKMNENIEYWFTIIMCILLLYIFLSGIINDVIH